jgi:hypothetical protein
LIDLGPRLPEFRVRTLLRAILVRRECAPAAPPPRAYRSLLAALASLGALGFACAERPESTLAELDRLAFVPAGECVLQPRSGFPIVCSNARPLLVDRFEATRAEWRAFEAGAAEADEAFGAVLATWRTDTDAWPASFMTLAEARGYAAARAMRLPTFREWIRIASGTRGLPYPWGGAEASSVANTLNLGVGHPLPVGTFEQGRTTLGTYDMAGNVREWVEDRLPRAPEDRTSSAPAWAMGGSYLSRQRRLHELDVNGELVFDQLDLEPASRSIDVGLRCVADAREYLLAHAGSYGGERSRARLVAIGASWGRAAVPLLEELAAAPGAPPALAFLLEGARR